jgi:hypothetical protein
MTIISNPVSGPVVGQPVSPFFGQQFGPGLTPANSVVALPAGVTALEAAARGSLPRNAILSAVNGVGPGRDINSDPLTVDQAISNGNGNQTTRGASLTPAGAINTQIFVDGIGSANAALSTGPAPTDTAALTEAPVSAATLGSNLGLSGGYGG